MLTTLPCWRGLRPGDLDLGGVCFCRCWGGLRARGRGDLVLGGVCLRRCGIRRGAERELYRLTPSSVRVTRMCVLLLLRGASTLLRLKRSVWRLKKTDTGRPFSRPCDAHMHRAVGH